MTAHPRTALSVNLNKVALVRNTRHLGIPSVTRAAQLCLSAGAHGITVHPRPDERHIRPQDVWDLAELMREWPGREFNIEGNPFHNLMDVAQTVVRLGGRVDRSCGRCSRWQSPTRCWLGQDRRSRVRRSVQRRGGISQMSPSGVVGSLNGALTVAANFGGASHAVCVQKRSSFVLSCAKWLGYTLGGEAKFQVLRRGHGLERRSYHEPMNRLHTELQRLFDTQPDAQGRVRTLVLGISGPADWPALAAVWRGVQTELNWPAPAIAINGVDAFELWMPLQVAVSQDEARRALQHLCARYLGDVAPARWRLWPALDEGLCAPPQAQPQLQAVTGRWSAFVAPDLAAVFGDDRSQTLRACERFA